MMTNRALSHKARSNLAEREQANRRIEIEVQPAWRTFSAWRETKRSANLAVIETSTQP